MQRNGQNRDDFKTYQRGLGQNHRRRIRVQVLNLEGKLIGGLPNGVMVIGGTYTGDPNGEPGKLGVAQLEILDPKGKLSFDPDASDRPMHRTRQLRIWDDRWIPGLGWVECKQHVGPIFDVDRDGPVVTVVVHDKSDQMGQNAWTEETYGKGMRRSEVQRQIAVNAGERRSRLDIPSTKARLPKKMVVLRMDVPWVKFKKVQPGKRAFYSGEVLRVRADPRKPVYTLSRRQVLSNPTLNRNAKDRPDNTVVFKGGKPKGKNKKRVVSKPAYLPKRHPHSPQRLGRNGVPRRYVKKIENDKIKSRNVANRLARQARDDLATSNAELAVSVVPFPHGEPGDLLKIPTPTGAVRVRYARVTIPYGPEGEMELGANRPTNGPAKRARPRKPPKKRRPGGGR